MSRSKPRERAASQDDEGARAPRRELDSERIRVRAKAPPNLIRRPLKLPPMQRVQGEVSE